MWLVSMRLPTSRISRDPLSAMAQGKAPASCGAKAFQRRRTPADNSFNQDPIRCSRSIGLTPCTCATVQYMGADLRGGYIGVPEQVLHGTGIGGGFELVDGKRVP